MKAIKRIIALSLLMLSLFAVNAFAENNVSEISVKATVRDDGSAVIVQIWKGEFHEGTENYIPIATGDIAVTDFKVSDANGQYEFVDNWKVSDDFEQKARKCGIVQTDDGVELCFGISKYGQNGYRIEYTVEDFIKSYTDYDGTNFMFVNPNMSTFPTDGKIVIALENGTELNEENSGIWAFGYEGTVEFSGGAVVAKTSQDLSGDNSMIVMLRLNKGIISPKKDTGISFDEVKKTAFEDSDYTSENEEASLLETVIGFIVLFGFFALFVGIAVLLAKRKKAIKKFYKEAQYFRDVPNGGNIEVSHYLAQNFDVSGEESLIIGALILSMINKGALEPQIEKNVGFFGKEKESVNLKLIGRPEATAEIALYDLFAVSAGNDNILQEKELGKYSYKHPEKINKFIKSVRKSGESKFVSNGGFYGGAGNCIKDLSEYGKAELAQVMGLKKYLDDFTLIAERGIEETVIWKEYMVYATLFGIGEKVMEQLKKVYPEKVTEFEKYNRNAIIATSYYRSMYTSSQRAIQAKRSSGAGGAASLGGGGGFSGGGHGGGSR